MVQEDQLWLVTEPDFTTLYHKWSLKRRLIICHVSKAISFFDRHLDIWYLVWLVLDQYSEPSIRISTWKENKGSENLEFSSSGSNLSILLVPLCGQTWYCYRVALKKNFIKAKIYWRNERNFIELDRDKYHFIFNWCFGRQTSDEVSDCHKCH